MINVEERIAGLYCRAEKIIPPRIDDFKGRELSQAVSLRKINQNLSFTPLFDIIKHIEKRVREIYQSDREARWQKLLKNRVKIGFIRWRIIQNVLILHCKLP